MHGNQGAEHREGGHHGDPEQPVSSEWGMVQLGDPKRGAEKSYGGYRGAPRRDRGGSLLHPHLSCVSLPPSCALEASGGRPLLPACWTGRSRKTKVIAV